MADFPPPAILTICQPLAHVQQKLCLVFATDWLPKEFVKSSFVPKCWQGFLCAMLVECHTLTTTRRRANMGASIFDVKNKSHARAGSASGPATFLTSSDSNSRMAALAQVRSLTVNECCPAFADGKPRDPVGASILAGLRRVVTLDSHSTVVSKDLPMRRRTDAV